MPRWTKEAKWRAGASAEDLKLVEGIDAQLAMLRTRMNEMVIQRARITRRSAQARLFRERNPNAAHRKRIHIERANSGTE